MKLSYTNFNYPIIETDRLMLRFLKETDWKAIKFLRSDKEINSLVIRPLTHTKEEALAFIERIQKSIKKGEILYWPITLNQENSMIGSICLWNFSEDRKTGEVGYDLHPNYHKKGIMNEAMLAVLEYGFKILGLNEIEAYTHRENISSKKLLTRNGFELVPNRVDTENENNLIYVLKK